MEKYVIYKSGMIIAKYTKKQYDNWIKHNAKRNCGLYSIIGDKNSKEFYVDLGRIYQVKIVEENK